MKDTYTYQIDGNLYVNLTNRCTNRCTFCVREQSPKYEGYSLWLEREPTAEEVIEEIGDPKRYREIVFCGYGEPTYKLEKLRKIAEFVKAQGGKTRLNTNGHGNAIHKKNIAPLLKGIDKVNISLNAPTEEDYDAVCRPTIENAFGELLSFARCLKQEGIDCLFSVVDCIGKEQIALCRKIADTVGIPLRVREFIENS